ncbi:MAG: 1,4-dihydroxy-2-naphthoate polyprenyltransferase, partial [Actinomycetota bacterium]|nr:1,4-dihydroxy-2-naphthoate polyprenyltransferase [Actinomycetota bacterium]
MRLWVEAARPRTLPAAVVPVLVGTSAAGHLIVWRFAAALLVSLALQVAVNYANDYFDGVRGVDTPERAGPRRAVASGLVRPSQMKAAVGLALAVAAAAGIALTIAVGPELLLVGALSIGAALAYSGGPRPYASAGLGEVFVFVFFGLVATVGSAYVQVETIPRLTVLASVPVGLLATAILVVNNLRDIPTDAAAGKKTLAVRLGPRGTRRLYAALLAGAAIAVVP